MRMWLLIALLGVTLCAWAQPDPNAPPPVDMRPEKQVQEWVKQIIPMLVAQPPMMTVAPDGIFVVRGGVLAKYDAKTLDAVGMVELFGPLPEENKANAQVNLDRLRRLLPGAMLVTNTDLMVVIGEQFFRVDRATLEEKVSVSLFQDQVLAPAERLIAVAAPPVLTLDGATLYVTRGSQLLAVTWQDGHVRAVGMLPDPFNGKLPAVGKKAAAAKPRKPVRNAGNPQPREVTVIGTLLRHADGDGIFWTLKAEEGGEYLLSGEPLAKLTDRKDLAGKRLRVTGPLTPPGKDDWGKGELEIIRYEILP